MQRPAFHVIPFAYHPSSEPRTASIRLQTQRVEEYTTGLTSMVLASAWNLEPRVRSDIRPSPKSPAATAIDRGYASLRADSRTRSPSLSMGHDTPSSQDYSAVTALFRYKIKYGNFRFRRRSTVFSISTAHRNSRARCKAAWIKPFSAGRLKAKSVPATPYHVRISSHPTSSSRTVRNCRAECT